ncbi:MAG: DUF6241 domain-containing protein [Bacillus sp. (in: Bacteria)]|nr:DUF6241 domain-containing protein [Bacillus sp. (in: firmicutes)]
MDNAAQYEKSQEIETIPVVDPVQAKEDAETKKREEIDKQQTAKIGGVQYEIAIDERSSQLEVIDVMHNMTHQKVKAEEKWGATPMIPDTINQVYDIVQNSQFERKDDLLAILAKWKGGHFREIDIDHNYFWIYKGGTVGKAYGVMSNSEEETFIMNNFGKEFLNQVIPAQE